MALVPMNDTIFGDLVEEDVFDELTEMYYSLTQSMSDHVFRDADRQLEAQLAAARKPVQFLVTVTAVGPDCRELKVGDTAILPVNGGTMVTVIDEATNIPKRVFCISERVVLARWEA